MRLLTLALWFPLLAACGSTPDTGDGQPGNLDALIKEWQEASRRADQTRTHGSGEHPMHLATMRRIESDLRSRCASPEGRKAVLDSIQRTQAGFQIEKNDIQQRINRLQVVGRQLTPQEMDFVERTGPAQIADIALEIARLRDLRKNLGL